MKVCACSYKRHRRGGRPLTLLQHTFLNFSHPIDGGQSLHVHWYGERVNTMLSVRQTIFTLTLLILALPPVLSAGTRKIDKETKFGFYVDKALLSTNTIVLNSTLNKRIDEIGNRVVRASDRPDIIYTFRVVNDATINAHSAAGGFVYISTGLLDILESEDELAAVLAHEIGHICRKHQIDFLNSTHVKRTTSTILGLGATAGIGVAGVATLQQIPPPYAPSDFEYHQRVLKIVDISLQLGAAVGDALTVSMIKGYGRKQELEADTLAIRYCWRAGYDPSALEKVLEKLRSIRDRLKLNQGNYVSNLINAEPGLEERIVRAQGLISKVD